MSLFSSSAAEACESDGAFGRARPVKDQPDGEGAAGHAVPHAGKKPPPTPASTASAAMAARARPSS